MPPKTKTTTKHSVGASGRGNGGPPGRGNGGAPGRGNGGGAGRGTVSVSVGRGRGFVVAGRGRGGEVLGSTRRGRSGEGPSSIGRGRGGQALGSTRRGGGGGPLGVTGRGRVGEGLLSTGRGKAIASSPAPANAKGKGRVEGEDGAINRVESSTRLVGEDNRGVQPSTVASGGRNPIQTLPGAARSSYSSNPSSENTASVNLSRMPTQYPSSSQQMINNRIH